MYPDLFTCRTPDLRATVGRMTEPACMREVGRVWFHQNSLDMELFRQKLVEQEQRYYIACDQVRFLDAKLNELFPRYELANARGKRTSRNSLRLQMSVAKNLRILYYQYALAKAELINQLRRHIYGNFATNILDEAESSDSESGSDES